MGFCCFTMTENGKLFSGRVQFDWMGLTIPASKVQKVDALLGIEISREILFGI